jgi:hypothetical protein
METSPKTSALEDRHFTIRELSKMWHFSEEFVRQLVKDEPGVTEWVRQRPGRRRYRVLRIPQSVAERLYRRAQERVEQEQPARSSGYEHDACGESSKRVQWSR